MNIVDKINNIDDIYYKEKYIKYKKKYLLLKNQTGGLILNKGLYLIFFCNSNMIPPKSKLPESESELQPEYRTVYIDNKKICKFEKFHSEGIRDVAKRINSNYSLHSLKYTDIVNIFGSDSFLLNLEDSTNICKIDLQNQTYNDSVDKLIIENYGIGTKDESLGQYIYERLCFQNDTTIPIEFKKINSSRASVTNTINKVTKEYIKKYLSNNSENLKKIINRLNHNKVEIMNKVGITKPLPEIKSGLINAYAIIDIGKQSSSLINIQNFNRVDLYQLINGTSLPKEGTQPLIVSPEKQKYTIEKLRTGLKFISKPGPALKKYKEKDLNLANVIAKFIISLLSSVNLSILNDQMKYL